MKGLDAYEIVKEECDFAFGGTANGIRVRKNLPIIEKELKALEIIRNHCSVIQKGILPKEKQDLLDEVLLCH